MRVKRENQKYCNVKNQSDYAENYLNLANAIVIRACEDYQSEDGKTPKSKMRKQSIVNFFNSKLFSLITDMKPAELIDRLEHGGKIKYSEYIVETRSEPAL